MKILLINGSPHKTGTTARGLAEMANEFKKLGAETEIFWLGTKAIFSCTGCGACKDLKKCVFNDVVNEARLKLSEADGFVFGSPVHYAGASGALTSFMGRLFFSELLANGYEFLRLKPACALVCARRAGTTAAFDQINRFFALAQMPIINGRYWNNLFGHDAEEAEGDAEGLLNLRTIARNMHYLIKCFELAKANGVEPPPLEETVITSFWNK